MTPKEKAKDLFDKHFDYVEAWSESNQIENAKKCALITVNEILNYIPQTYWFEVETEIKKIKI